MKASPFPAHLRERVAEVVKAAEREEVSLAVRDVVLVEKKVESLVEKHAVAEEEVHLAKVEKQLKLIDALLAEMMVVIPEVTGVDPAEVMEAKMATKEDSEETVEAEVAPDIPELKVLLRSSLLLMAEFSLELVEVTSME
jgi:hypothetical protein